MLKAHRYPVPDGYGIVQGGRIRAFDLVWDGGRRQWQGVNVDALKYRDVDKFVAVARRINVPPRDLSEALEGTPH